MCRAAGGLGSEVSSLVHCDRVARVSKLVIRCVERNSIVLDFSSPSAYTKRVYIAYPHPGRSDS